MIVSNLKKRSKMINKNSGLPESQVVFLTQEIKYLNEHIKANRHDYVSKLSLEKKINKRRSLLSYLKKNSEERYKIVVSKVK